MLEVTLDNTLEQTYINGELTEMLNELNMAAIQGKQFVILVEARDDLDDAKVVFPVHKIVKIRPVSEEQELAFVGR